MAEYIERETYRKRLADLEGWCQDLRKPGLKQALWMFDETPAADVAPVRRGKWIFGKDLPEHIGAHPKNKWHLFCTCCHHQALNLTLDNDDTQDVETDFCPFCGADMREIEP